MIRRLIVVIGVCILTGGCRSQAPQSNPPAPTEVVVHSSRTRVFTVADESSSTVFVQTPGSPPHRLTSNTHAWESDPVLSGSGQIIAYSTAAGPDGRSEVWVARVDGSHAHRVSGDAEDAVMPAFVPDEHSLLYVRSRFNGHYSPIARPRRHKFDVVKVAVDADGPMIGAPSLELTHQSFFDLQSLSVSQDGERFLISTSGYPIGSLIEEFEFANPNLVKRMFQPHVPSEPQGSPQVGQAAYTNGGMEIVFTAATEGKDGMFNYNIYKMSDVTGGELVKLADHSGTVDRLDVANDGTVVFVAGGKQYAIDPKTNLIHQE